jgi:hypothetical protein
MKCGASARSGWKVGRVRCTRHAAVPPGNLPNEGAQLTHFGRSKDHRERGLAGGLVCDELSTPCNMRATQLLHDLGQSLRLDNIPQDLLNEGPLKRYIAEFSVNGPTSNPTIFDHAIRESAAKGENGEKLFKAFADYGEVGSAIPENGDTDAILNEFANARADVDVLAAQLQNQGADSFDKSWNNLLKVISSNSAALRTAAL